MRFKHPAWIPVAWMIALGNLVAVGPAAAVAEPFHATIHAALAGLFALGARHLMARRRPAVTQEPVQLAIEDMQARLWELEERLDFAERMLTKYRDEDRLEAPPH